LEIQERRKAETNTNASLILAVFADVFNEHVNGVTKPTVRQVAKEQYGYRDGWSGSNFRKTFERAWGRLQAKGIIEENGGARWIVVPPDDRTPQPW
jgi:hypothetical protein